MQACLQKNVLSSRKVVFASLSSKRGFTNFYTIPTRNGRVKVDARKVPHYIGHGTSRNMMKYNEDRYFLGFLNLPIQGHNQRVFNASVFDGHGGEFCAEYLKQRLGTYLEQADIPQLTKSLSQNYKSRFGGYWRSSLILNSATIKQYQQAQFDDLSVRLPLAFLQADYELTAEDKLSGSTCTSAYIYTLDPNAQLWDSGVDANLVIAQVGDSRAIICDNAGNVLPLSAVHHADSPREEDRLAGYPLGFNTTNDGVRRFLQYVNTRSFGDYQGKSRGISAEPDVIEYLISPGKGRLPGKEAFVVLITDGVTDRASDQEICDIVIQKAVSGGSMRGSPQDAAAEILSYVEMLGTEDNATAIVIRLGGWGDWSEWRDRSGALRVNRLKYNYRRQ